MDKHMTSMIERKAKVPKNDESTLPNQINSCEYKLKILVNDGDLNGNFKWIYK